MKDLMKSGDFEEAIKSRNTFTIQDKPEYLTDFRIDMGQGILTMLKSSASSQPLYETYDKELDVSQSQAFVKFDVLNIYPYIAIVEDQSSLEFYSCIE